MLKGTIEESDVKTFIELCLSLRDDLLVVNPEMTTTIAETQLAELRSYRSEIWRGLLAERLKGNISGNKMDKLYLNPMQIAYHEVVMALRKFEEIGTRTSLLRGKIIVFQTAYVS